MPLQLSLHWGSAEFLDTLKNHRSELEKIAVCFRILLIYNKTIIIQMFYESTIIFLKI